MKKRILSLLLCAAMMVSMVVFSGAASEEDAPELTAAETLAAEETEAPVATPESTEAAEPTDTPAPTETAEPTATPESTETAEPTDTPAPTETAEPTDTPAPTADPETGEEEINRWGTFTDEAFALYQELGGTPLYFGSLPESIFVLSSCMVGETLWYKFSTEDWEDWTYDTAYCYVEAEYVTLEEEPEVTPTPAPTTTPEAGTVTTLEDKEHGVTVSGENIPEGVTLSVTDVSGSYADSAMALDIKLMNGEAEWQPSSAGTYVAVTLDVSENGWEDGTIVTLTHIHGGTSTDYLYVVIDQKLTFYTDSFSIYVVKNVKDTESSTGAEKLTTNNVTMTVGDEKIFYYNLSSNQKNATLVGAVWSVTDESNAVTYTVYDNGYNEGSSYWTWKAQWIKITAKNAGTVTVTATCYYSYTTSNGGDRPGPGDGTTTNYTTATETFTINVSEQSGLHIEDKIAETGCLVPMWDATAASADDGYVYTWTRSDGQTVRTDALHEDGTVNVSIDRGGVTNSRAPITYTVTATTDGGKTETATFQVIYGQEILNPSFESPALTSFGNNVTQRAVYNGYEGLYWKTTAPGTIDKLGLDVELWTPAFGQSKNQGPTTTPDNLKQYAELNAEAAGTLYQDMLTTSGATLSWSFSHAGRTQAKNKMYIVIAATKNAQSVGDDDDIKALIAAATQAGTIPNAANGGTGLTFTYNGGTYVIWQHTATAMQWSTLSGTYTVPEGQYLTRLFFAADPTDNNTLGNFIDGVDAGEKMSYKIEYYPDGNLDSSKTESGNGTVYTTVDLKNLQSYLDLGYVITSVKVNVKDYSGDIKNGLYITDYGTVEGQTENILVKIILRKKAITVTKVVTIEGWDKLTDAQRLELVKNYTATFELYDSNGMKKDTVTLTVSGVANDGSVTVTGEFAQASSLSDGTYTIKETSYGTLTGYVWESTTYNGGTSADGGVSVSISNNSPVAAVTVTNAYKIGLADLTIKKTGAQGIDENQTFIFKVIGTDNNTKDIALTVTIHGDGSVTIKDLPIGNYTVTEVTDWSWRYEPESGNSRTVTIAASGNTVTFKNTRNNDKWLDGNAVAVNTYENTEKSSD